MATNYRNRDDYDDWEIREETLDLRIKAAKAAEEAKARKAEAKALRERARASRDKLRTIERIAKMTEDVAFAEAIRQQAIQDALDELGITVRPPKSANAPVTP